MTKQVKRALKSVGVPSIRLHSSGQYFTRIGYRESRSGKRQRACFYLGRDESAAALKGAALKSEWKGIRRKGGRLAVWPLGKAIAPSPSMAKLTPQAISSAVEQYHAEARAEALDLGEQEQQPRQRIAQVRELYLDYRKAKLGIGSGQGINNKSYTNECRNLKGALAAVDQTALIDSLDYAGIERLRDSIYRRVDSGANPISKRTANNYWTEAARMLQWADRQGNINYQHPRNVADLFKRKIRNPDPINIAEYDAELLKQLLAQATDRQRLYIYLGLNCGHNQVDIGTLRAEAIADFKGKPSIIRKRSKTKHQNDFEALHTLWPETAALLQQEMAARNPQGLALLSERNTPLYRQTPHCDIISDTYLGLQQRAEVDLPFKQLRKIGATEIQRIGGDEARRLYKAGTIDSGDKVYVRHSWDKLTPHLEAWGEQLRRDGVLTMPKRQQPKRQQPKQQP
jgi:hypothetical protein